jgi:hypothetical protein
MKSLLFFNDWEEISWREWSTNGNNKAPIYTAKEENLFIFLSSLTPPWEVQIVKITKFWLQLV